MKFIKLLPLCILIGTNIIFSQVSKKKIPTIPSKGKVTTFSIDPIKDKANFADFSKEKPAIKEELELHSKLKINVLGNLKSDTKCKPITDFLDQMVISNTIINNHFKTSVGKTIPVVKKNASTIAATKPIATIKELEDILVADFGTNLTTSTTNGITKLTIPKSYLIENSRASTKCVAMVNSISNFLNASKSTRLKIELPFYNSNERKTKNSDFDPIFILLARNSAIKRQIQVKQLLENSHNSTHEEINFYFY